MLDERYEQVHGDSESQESKRIQHWINTGQYDSPAFLETDKEIPCPSTLFSIFHLAPRYCIELVSDNTQNGGNSNNQRQYKSVVICKRPKRKRSAVGAAMSSDKDTASFLAWRNAIRALLTTEELLTEQRKYIL